jgi:PGF-pre-PGF domain-containing protein
MTIEGLTDQKAADIIGKVTTRKAASIIEVVTTQKAAGIIEALPTRKAADIIEAIAIQKAFSIIEAVTDRKAANIIEAVTIQRATDIIGGITVQKAAGVLEQAGIARAAAIMEQLSTARLSDIIPAMSEASLTERLPGLSLEKLNSIETQLLFDALPGIPTEQLINETPPQPPAGLGAPVVVYDTPAGAKYLTPQTLAGEWVVVMDTPEPVDRLMLKTNRALTDVGTTLQISAEQPPEALVMLPSGQIASAYLTISFENAAPEDIALGHLTFKVTKEWLEQESVHKWSVALYRYDPETNKWLALPTKRVKEDDTYVYYTVAVTHFSTFAISGSQTVPPPAFQVTDLEISPAEASSGEDVTISADVTNTSASAGTYAATLWLDNTATAGKDVSIAAGQTATVSFTVAGVTEGSYEVRIDRLFGSLDVAQAVTPSATTEPPATPSAPTAPTATPPVTTAPPVTPVTPVTTANWWLIGGIIVAVIIIAAAVWRLAAARRSG